MSLFCFTVQLSKGYPLPALGKMKLVNTQLQIMQVRKGFFFFFLLNSVRLVSVVNTFADLCRLQDYLMIGTDVQFTG